MTQFGTEFVRVKQRDTDAGPISVTRGMYEFNPDAYDLLDDEAATDTGGNPIPPDSVLALQPEPTTYEDWKVAELQVEIDRRNEGRDPDGGDFLDRKGNKSDLAAALEADDANPPTSGSEPADSGQ